ncbi:tetraspanin-11 isoform X4 [Manis javanica]|uniref:tetraspanin-11 isoform X4 n=1 Tax=Manis javanica TaxID=9974 RepID=UPI00187AD05A|nr:tetraspanin-11 isoform X4 [Manis javanica]
MAHYKAEQDDWLMVYLKYLLFVFNFFFWVGGAAVLAVGVWTLAEKSGYLSVLASSTFAASAYILISAGALVMVTGFLGFGAVVREDRSCLSTYFCLLLVIFLVELVAGVLAHMYYQRLSDELKQHLAWTLAENYGQPGAAEITSSVDRLQQDFKCCGSNSSADWQHSAYILSREAEGRRVPDSCCKTVVTHCGQRTHPSNIYKVEPRCGCDLRSLAGRLHHQAGAVPGRPPAAHGGSGPRGGLSADLWDGPHLLLAPEAPAALLLVANLMPLQAPPVRTDAQIPPTRPAYSASARQETLRDAFYSVPSPPHPTSA